MSFRTGQRTVADCGIASTPLRSDLSIATIWKPKGTEHTWIKWRTSDDHATRGPRGRLLLGHAGPDPPLSPASFPPASATRAARCANATYRNHGTHAEAIEIIFDPRSHQLSRSFSSSSSRFTIPRPRTARATIGERATAPRSSTPATSRGVSPRIPSPMSMPRVSGRGRW